MFAWIGRVIADSFIGQFFRAAQTWWEERQARADAMARSAAEQRSFSAQEALDAQKRMEAAGAKAATRESTQETLDAGKF